MVSRHASGCMGSWCVVPAGAGRRQQPYVRGCTEAMLGHHMGRRKHAWQPKGDLPSVLSPQRKIKTPGVLLRSLYIALQQAFSNVVCMRTRCERMRACINPHTRSEYLRFQKNQAACPPVHCHCQAMHALFEGPIAAPMRRARPRGAQRSASASPVPVHVGQDGDGAAAAVRHDHGRALGLERGHGAAELARDEVAQPAEGPAQRAQQDAVGRGHPQARACARAGAGAHTRVSACLRLRAYGRQRLPQTPTDACGLRAGQGAVPLRGSPTPVGHGHHTSPRR